ncbi:hypothetical protein [Neptunitalea lumnitzerae]|uniref:Uncharacterized protein n=1 Tax=Neptunitalea lumnitzerae TaxID=2965509 RepID=A0ABQ5MGF3_9FLAO|nr:hypothetical protein [Neptunitalea sp. Y10]GLB48468.1 hypothetical protein Y10_08360 [Neptunitalea sp. Y10]
MKLSFTYFLVGFLFLTQIGVAQEKEKKNYKDIVKEGFIAYDSIVVSGDYEKAKASITPAFFEYISEELYVDKMNEIYNNEDFPITTYKAENVVVGDTINVEGKYYTIITYDTHQDIPYVPKEGESKEKSQAKFGSIRTFFKKQYGADKVEFNKKTQNFEVKLSKEAYAISDNLAEWKFLAINIDGMEGVYRRILPEDVLPKTEEEVEVEK